MMNKWVNLALATISFVFAIGSDDVVFTALYSFCAIGNMMLFKIKHEKNFKE